MVYLRIERYPRGTHTNLMHGLVMFLLQGEVDARELMNSLSKSANSAHQEKMTLFRKKAWMD